VSTWIKLVISHTPLNPYVGHPCLLGRRLVPVLEQRGFYRVRNHAIFQCQDSCCVDHDYGFGYVSGSARKSESFDCDCDFVLLYDCDLTTRQSLLRHWHSGEKIPT